MNQNKPPISPALTDEQPRTPLGEIRKRLRGLLRTILAESDLTSDQRDLFLKHYHWGARRAIRHAARGEDLRARAGLANLELFLLKAGRYPSELAYAVGLAQHLGPVIRRISERISIEHTDQHDLDALRRVVAVTNPFAYMRKVADRDSKRQSDAAKLTPHPKDFLRDRAIATMARWRRSDEHELENYLDAAKMGPIDDVRIIPPKRDKKIFLVEYTGHADIPARKRKKRVRLSTLREWWTQAKKRIASQAQRRSDQALGNGL